MSFSWNSSEVVCHCLLLDLSRVFSLHQSLEYPSTFDYRYVADVAPPPERLGREVELLEDKSNLSSSRLDILNNHVELILLAPILKSIQ